MEAHPYHNEIIEAKRALKQAESLKKFIEKYETADAADAMDDVCCAIEMRIEKLQQAAF